MGSPRGGYPLAMRSPEFPPRSCHEDKQKDSQVDGGAQREYPVGGQEMPGKENEEAQRKKDLRAENGHFEPSLQIRDCSRQGKIQQYEGCGSKEAEWRNSQ